MRKIKVSAVSYLNSSPFIYGINHSAIKNEIELSLDIPSVCSDKLIHDKADLGLIPIAEIPVLKESYIISDYCIGATGKVNSVLLLSEVELTEVKTIFLDYQSRTSAQLIKILAQQHWNIFPEFQNTREGYENRIKGTTAGLVIGDRALMLKNKFRFSFDLAEAWFEMTGLPFVFACWVANKKLPSDFIRNFNAALYYGVHHIDDVVSENSAFKMNVSEMKQYFKKNISYELNDEKKKGMELFFNFLKKEKSVPL
ncbi:MAG TPA: menaquinone biosynthesis protein [Bacteroidia bacterium]|nr:menaquinone biosynthesis protein [Bacteroidia bacterium]